MGESLSLLLDVGAIREDYLRYGCCDECCAETGKGAECRRIMTFCFVI